MATVHLARDSALERPVAIKTLADNLASDGALRRRFLREATLAARLSHPNVVQVYDVGEWEGRPAIVIEYVDGATLAAELGRRGRFAPAEAADLGVQVCAGLAHAHAAGIVHRDVKPQNLLLDREGTVKIADFGIAHLEEGTRLTQAGTVLGTAAYLAPEQARGDPPAPAADLYALGAVLYELVSGTVPYAASSLPELVAKQAAGAARPLAEAAPAVPETLARAVTRCLSTDPAGRPGSAAELGRELRLGLDPPTVPLNAGRHEPETVALPARRRRPPGRRLALAGGAAAVLAAIGVGLGLGLSGGSPAAPQAPSPARLGPITGGDTPGDLARNLAAWLRGHAAPAG